MMYFYATICLNYLHSVLPYIIIINRELSYRYINILNHQYIYVQLIMYKKTEKTEKLCILFTIIL